MFEVDVGTNKDKEGFGGYVKYDMDNKKPEYFLGFRKKFAKAGLVDKANNVKPGDDLGRGVGQRLKGKKIKYITSGMGGDPLTEYQHT
jgi:hypothetical protein